MKREVFMSEAEQTARGIFEGKIGGIMNLVRQAWAEGKRNAEVETLRAAIEEALDKKEQKSDSEAVYPTWGEWLIQQGVLKAGTTTMYGITWQPVGDNLFESIPADFAKKLGVKPKEEQYEP